MLESSWEIITKIYWYGVLLEIVHLFILGLLRNEDGIEY